MSDSASAPASSPSPPPPATSISSLTVNVKSDSTTSASSSTSTTPTKALTPSSFSASTIAEYKQKLETFTTPETKDITAAVDILNTLMTITISAETLAATKIGVLVNQLRKHDNKEVAYTCRALLERWKKAVQPIIARTTSVTDQIRKDKATPSKSTSEQKSSAPTTPTPTTPTTPNGTLTKTISNPSVRRTSSTTTATTTSTSASTSTSTTPSTTPSTSTAASTSTTTTTPVLARRTSSVGTPGQYPTFTSNGLTMGKTGDAFRNKIQQLMYDGLLRAATSTATCLEMCVTLESCLYKHFGNKTDAPYKNRYREIAMNIKDENNDLAERLFNGRITCERLVSMPVQEMASDSLQKQREEERVYARDATRSDWNRDKGTTEMFQCGKCKQKKCKYYQMQTRSADEPMTTFVTCMNCGNRWKC